jgi:GDPmannose 4,6-dehydratase
LVWEGENENKKAINKKNNKVIVIVNPKYYRPAEVDLLLGDPKKAESCLNWKRKVDFPSLVEMMVTSDIKQYKKQL